MPLNHRMIKDNKKIYVPSGYQFSVAAAGIKYKDRPDMALIYSEREAVVAGTFTSNRVKAAPVVLDGKGHCHKQRKCECLHRAQGNDRCRDHMQGYIKKT